LPRLIPKRQKKAIPNLFLPFCFGISRGKYETSHPPKLVAAVNGAPMRFIFPPVIVRYAMMVRMQ
jgi:hypothetical protein